MFPDSRSNFALFCLQWSPAPVTPLPENQPSAPLQHTALPYAHLGVYTPCRTPAPRELPFPLPPPLRPRLKPEQLPPSSAETLLTSNKLPCTPDPALCPLLGSTSCTQCNTQTVNAAILLKNQYWSRAYLVKNIVTFDQNTELYIAIWLKDIVMSF